VLDIMRTRMDGMFVGDGVAARHISGFLWELQEVVTKMKENLLGLKEIGCDPDVFYNEVGQDATRTRGSGSFKDSRKQ
jgi:hypothetical protein